jgi:hypothetical protein
MSDPLLTSLAAGEESLPSPFLERPQTDDYDQSPEALIAEARLAILKLESYRHPVKAHSRVTLAFYYLSSYILPGIVAILGIVLVVINISESSLLGFFRLTSSDAKLFLGIACVAIGSLFSLLMARAARRRSIYRSRVDELSHALRNLVPYMEEKYKIYLHQKNAHMD